MDEAQRQRRGENTPQLINGMFKPQLEPMEVKENQESEKSSSSSRPETPKENSSQFEFLGTFAKLPNFILLFETKRS